MKSNSFNTNVFLLFFSLILLANISLFSHLFHSIAFGAIIAGIFYPLFLKIENKLNIKRKKEWASLITCFLIFLIIILPLIYLIIQLSQETVGLYGHLKSALNRGEIQNFFFGHGPAAALVEKGLELANMDLNQEDIYQMILTKAQSYSGLLFNTLNGWLGDIFNFCFQFFVTMTVIYGIFTKGNSLKKWFFELSPLPNSEEQMVLEKFKQMNFVTIVCNGIGGILQGGLAGIGFWIAGINSLFLWSTVMVILAFIPLIGMSIIFIPASLYLYLSGSQGMAVFLFIYCSLISLVVENWFKPRFIGSKVKINGILLFLYIIGGMATFGMAGIFYGPLLCIILLTTTELFQKNYLPKLRNRNLNAPDKSS